MECSPRERVIQPEGSVSTSDTFTLPLRPRHSRVLSVQLPYASTRAALKPASLPVPPHFSSTPKSCSAARHTCRLTVSRTALLYTSAYSLTLLKRAGIVTVKVRGVSRNWTRDGKRIGPHKKAEPRFGGAAP